MIYLGAAHQFSRDLAAFLVVLVSRGGTVTVSTDFPFPPHCIHYCISLAGWGQRSFCTHQLPKSQGRQGWLTLGRTVLHQKM
jgi:hypothetical protein